MLEQKLKILRTALGNFIRQGSNEYYFTCPFCNHERKKKLAINLAKNSYHCWVCDGRGKNLRRLLKSRLTQSQLYEWDKINNVVDLSQLDEDIFQEQIKVLEEVIQLPEEFTSLANKNLPLSSKFPMKYLKDRGFTKEDIVLWKAGYCASGEYSGRIIIPSFNENGDVNYFVARSYTDSFPKYMNPKVSKDIVFNELYLDWDSDIVLVEGVFDAMKAQNAIPLLGSTLNQQSNLFKKIVYYEPNIYIALDPDAEKKASYLIENLIQYDLKLFKIDIEGFGDVGEMTKEQFLEAKANAQLIGDDWVLEKGLLAI